LLEAFTTPYLAWKKTGGSELQQKYLDEVNKWKAKVTLEENATAAWDLEELFRKKLEATQTSTKKAYDDEYKKYDNEGKGDSGTNKTYKDAVAETKKQKGLYDAALLTTNTDDAA